MLGGERSSGMWSLVDCPYLSLHGSLPVHLQAVLIGFSGLAKEAMKLGGAHDGVIRAHLDRLESSGSDGVVL